MWHPWSVNRMTQGGRGSGAGRSPSASESAVAEPSAGRRLPEDRYRRGARRTAAQPLAASWEPEVGEPDERRPAGGRRRGFAGMVANYGWRVYAIPVLLVLTALVVLDSATPSDTSANAGPGAASAAASKPPAASEIPAAKPDLTGTTAELPNGPDVSKEGVGTFRTIPGTTEKKGQGELFKYTIAIEDGVKPADYNNDEAAFARTIDEILADPRSWVGTGQVAMQRVQPNENPDFSVTLTSTNTDHTICGFDIPFEASCWDQPTKRVYINVARWVRGAKVYGSDIAAYRQYAINHEVGHALRHGHEACKENGAPAPVMMQQTFGVSNDFVAKLNAGHDVVEADGKVCVPNPWPAAGKG